MSNSDATRLHKWRAAWAVYSQPRVIGMGFLGFSSGLPFLLVFSTLSAWLAQVGVSLTLIGFFSWIGLTYSIKFFWAPVIDRLPLPLLTHWLGHRRSWILLAQIGIAAGLVGMALTNPVTDLSQIALFALLVAFSSATQDVSIDAWRIEAVEQSIQGAMAATYQAGYRIAMLAAGAGAFYIAAMSTWPTTYLVMAMLVGVGMIAVFCVGEPERKVSRDAMQREQRVIDFIEGHADWPAWLRDGGAWLVGAVVCPFVDFFARYGRPALLILLFVSIFRITDITLGVMANPFYLDMGYTLAEIASVSKIFGVLMTLVGAGLGGVLVVRYGITRPLFAGAVLAAATNLLFAWLASHGPNDATMAMLNANLLHRAAELPQLQALLLPHVLPWQADTPGLIPLALTISADNLSGGMAGSAFIAYLSSLTNTGYTATQYALFSSLMTLPGKFIGGFSGLVVDGYGYVTFFGYTALAGVPAILLAAWLIKYHGIGSEQTRTNNANQDNAVGSSTGHAGARAGAESKHV